MAARPLIRPASDWRRLSAAALALLLLLLAAASLLWAAEAYRQRSAGQALAAAQLRDRLSQALETGQSELPRLRRQAALYASWQQAAWDDAGRVAEISRRLAEYAAARQSGSLRHALLGGGQPYAPGGSRLGWIATPARLQLTGVHEGDLLDLLRDLPQVGGLPALVRACRLTRADGLPAAIDAECELDWLHIGPRPEGR